MKDKHPVDQVVGRIADREKAIRAGGIVCSSCSPFTENRLIDGSAIRVRESDLDVPASAASGYVKVVRCGKCGSFWNPFKHEWEKKTDRAPG